MVRLIDSVIGVAVGPSSDAKARPSSAIYESCYAISFPSFTVLIFKTQLTYEGLLPKT